MNALRRHRLLRRYSEGLDALAGEGVNVGDFIPWLNVVGKVLGAAGQGGAQTQQQPSQMQQMQMMKMQQEQQARAKAEADAAKTRLLVYSVLGVLGLGGAGLATYLIVRKK